MSEASNSDAESADRYRQRSAELRTIAETMSDAKSREILQTIADDYERMAKTHDAISRTETTLKRLAT